MKRKFGKKRQESRKTETVFLGHEKNIYDQKNKGECDRTMKYMQGDKTHHTAAVRGGYI